MNPDTIFIMGKQVEARRESVAIDRLFFFPDNPRVYAAIRDMEDFANLTSEEKQVRIYQQLLQEPSVKNLISEIKRDKGLQEPVIVRWDTQQVIEGNSRLAVYRKLNDESPDNEQWKHIHCLIVASLTDEEQTRLLGQAHLLGKTEWSRYAKALYCYRWVKEQQRERSALSNLSGISITLIDKFVKTIQLMNENNDKERSRFSHYEVLCGTLDIKSAIEKSSILKDTLLSQIKMESFKALELRKRLPTIIAKPRILRKFEKREVSFEDAYDRAKISGAERRLKKIRDSLDDVEKNDLTSLERQEVKAVQQVVRQIQRRLKRVSEMVESELASKSS